VSEAAPSGPEGWGCAGGDGAREPAAALLDRVAPIEIPEEPAEAGAYLRALRGILLDPGSLVRSPLYLGHMTSVPPDFLKSVVELVVEANQNVVKLDTARGAIPLERQTIAMLHRLVFDRDDTFYARHAQAPESTLGIFTSGGTLANVTALWCMRNAARRRSPDGVPPLVVGSRLMHYSFEKAVDLLGLPLALARVDERHRVDAADVRRIVSAAAGRGQPVLAVVAIAGTTDSGSIDPIGELAEIAHEAGAALLVDAAWGAPILLSRRHRALLAGIDQADVVTLCGHKQFHLPIGTSLVCFADPDAAAAIEKRADYQSRAGSWDLGRRSVEGSRPASSALLHATLHLLGRRGFETRIDASFALARHAADWIRRSALLELLVEPTTNIVVYRPRAPRLGDGAAPDERAADRLTLAVQAEQAQSGRGFVSWTRIPRANPRERTIALRLITANPDATADHVTAVLEEQVAIVRRLLGSAFREETPA
jgi:glutamate/tyrosine decarboxylase-like PLP-dependent enzyme